MVKKIINVFIALYIMLILAIAGPGLAGIHIYTVTSGSMEPAIPAAAAIYVKEVPFAQISTGDVITYMISEDTAATHRVLEVHDADKYFITKGDANDTADAKPVPYTNVCGKVLFHVPYLGYGITLLNTTGGYIMLISLGLLLIVMDFLFSDCGKEKEKQEQDASDADTKDRNLQERKEDICEKIIQ